MRSEEAWVIEEREGALMEGFSNCVPGTNSVELHPSPHLNLGSI